MIPYIRTFKYSRGKPQITYIMPITKYFVEAMNGKVRVCTKDDCIELEYEKLVIRGAMNADIDKNGAFRGELVIQYIGLLPTLGHVALYTINPPRTK